MKLGLIFTRSTTLGNWVQRGHFEREIRYYSHLIEIGVYTRVQWFTYGSESELEKELRAAGRLPKDISVCHKPTILRGKLGDYLYSLIMPFIHRHQFRECRILKTNQMDGSWTGWMARGVVRRPWWARTGYTLSFFLEKQQANRLKIAFFKWLEKFVYARCDKGSVSSKQDLERFQAQWRGQRKLKLPEIVPNYIDTDLFTPGVDAHKRLDRILFVGRLNAQKNLFALFGAVKATGVGLDIVGSGEMETELKQWVKTHEADISFLGNIPNSELAEVYKRYKYFALTSLYEGMPKSLLEAMSCGLACIGTPVPGIEEVLDSGRTGIISASTQAVDIEAGIRQLIAADTASSLGISARAFVSAHYSLRSVARKESAIVQELVS